MKYAYAIDPEQSRAAYLVPSPISTSTPPANWIAAAHFVASLLEGVGVVVCSERFSGVPGSTDRDFQITLRIGCADVPLFAIGVWHSEGRG